MSPIAYNYQDLLSHDKYKNINYQIYVFILLVLGRNVGRSEDSVEREQFLQEKLHVPRPWIAEAKAVYASTVGNYGDQAWYLIQVIYIFYTFRLMQGDKPK